MYGQELAEVYEAIYRSRGKSWVDEADYVTEVIRSRAPEARSLLDVACGTGAHLEEFSRPFDPVQGLEIAEPMLELARQRLPDIPVHAGDMREFELDRTFDAVCCLFCSIGYLETVDELRSAIRSMAEHVEPGGVLVIEPWWFPERFIEGYVAGDMVIEDGRTVARMSHSTRQDRATRMEVRFMVGDENGIAEFTEVDMLTLFTRDEYEDAFAEASCPAEYLEGGLTGRGLFVGTRS